MVSAPPLYTVSLVTVAPAPLTVTLPNIWSPLAEP
jgi:hypothetical protein